MMGPSDNTPCQRVWRNANLATLVRGLGEVTAGLVAARNGRIVYAGPENAAPPLEAEDVVDCEGRWITPGLIDPHTHLVYAGDRAAEFQMRLEGRSYEEIARAGGGILSTVRATRMADEAQLIEESLPRLDALQAEGVTTVEIKSGYGLTLDDELKQLRVAGALGRQREVTICRTFLGAHATPDEFRSDKAGYLDWVCREMIPAVASAGLAEAVDAFCETIAFTPQDVARVFESARSHGLAVKLHADQLSNQCGASLAAGFGALSADHLEYADETGVAALAQAGTVAVLLPGAFYFTRETKKPPIEALRRSGASIALATDCNPGTSPLTSPLLAMNLAATLFRMTVPECIAGFTREAARALGHLDDIGTLEAGKRCDLAIWDVERLAELVYRIGFNPLHQRIWGGQ